MSFPMLLLTGKVDNVFLTPQKENRQGNKYGNEHKVQLLVDQPQDNGEIKRGLIDVKTDHPDFFRSMLDRRVSLPVRVYTFQGNLGFAILGSWSPPTPSAPHDQQAVSQGTPA